MRVQNDVHGNNNNNNHVVNQNNNQNNENQAAENPANEIPPVAVPNADTGTNPAADSAAPRAEPPVPPIPERPSPVAVTLLAIRTFFLSLVPEQHAL